jgi:hypothetical protein
MIDLNYICDQCHYGGRDDPPRTCVWQMGAIGGDRMFHFCSINCILLWEQQHWCEFPLSIDLRKCNES